jgi:hypothetical protein
MSRSSRINRNISPVAAADSGCPLRNTQPPLLLCKRPRPAHGRKVICSPVLSISSESPGSSRNSSLNGLGMTTGPPYRWSVLDSWQSFMGETNRGLHHNE